MAYTAPVVATAIEGLQNDSALGTNSSHEISNSGVSSPNVVIAAGRQLCFGGQVANQTTTTYQSTNATAISATGLQSFTLTPAAGLQQGQFVTWDTGGNLETIQLVTYNSSTGAGTAVFAKTHSSSTSTGFVSNATAVADQPIGTVAIPNGTTNGTVITVTNAKINATSHIFLQRTGNGGTITDAYVAQSSIVTTTNTQPGSFGITVVTSGPTTSAVDCWYWIVN